MYEELCTCISPFNRTPGVHHSIYCVNYRPAPIEHTIVYSVYDDNAKLYFNWRKNNMKIYYNEKQLESCAKFVFENNTAADKWVSTAEELQDFIMSRAFELIRDSKVYKDNSQVRTLTTLGFFIIARYEEQFERYDVRFLVDPSILFEGCDFIEVTI